MGSSADASDLHPYEVLCPHITFLTCYMIQVFRSAIVLLCFHYVPYVRCFCWPLCVLQSSMVVPRQPARVEKSFFRTLSSDKVTRCVSVIWAFCRFASGVLLICRSCPAYCRFAYDWRFANLPMPWANSRFAYSTIFSVFRLPQSCVQVSGCGHPLHLYSPSRPVQWWYYLCVCMQPSVHMVWLVGMYRGSFPMLFMHSCPYVWVQVLDSYTL